MKKFLLIFFVILSLRHYSQATFPNLASSLPHDTCLNKKFSIVFYLIPDSSFYPINPANLNAIINTTLTNFVNQLNIAFKPICVSFEACSTVVIPNYPFSVWTPTVEPIVTSNWYTDKTINFYLPVSVTSTVANDNSAYTYPPPATNTNTAKDIVVVPMSSLTVSNGVGFASHIPIHVMGHFFGLPHTFDELGTPATPAPPVAGMSNEFVDRTNCSTNGDRFCDTEADPYPQQYNAAPGGPKCFYQKIPGQTDGKSQYYVPPVDNLMSLYGCRCKFTQEQYNHMARVILKQRLYLH